MTSDDEREVPLIDDNDLVVLPDQTADDLDTDWRDAAGRKLRDLELLENRPPHWD